ncbi:unnamed protein product [Hermetia illucens]|uniref:Uncharacterized protein n=1 Tax=Hermetia illucens TaxID=343691 RepID=A0A7R8UZQ4_HERIL|nr:unnamed protein product [Hermetia illucens]
MCVLRACTAYGVRECVLCAVSKSVEAAFEFWLRAKKVTVAAVCSPPGTVVAFIVSLKKTSTTRLIISKIQNYTTTVL